MKKTKRLLALILALVTLSSAFCISATAATSYKGKSKTFYVRLSEDYSKVGKVVITATNSSGTTGTIKFSTIYVYSQYGCLGIDVDDPKSSCPLWIYDKTTTYSYSISKMKDGGTITLKQTSSNQFAPGALSGKIHTSGGNSWNNIWKIDCLKCTSTSMKGTIAGIYFRNT